MIISSSSALFSITSSLVTNSWENSVSFQDGSYVQQPQLPFPSSKASIFQLFVTSLSRHDYSSYAVIFKCIIRVIKEIKKHSNCNWFNKFKCLSLPGAVIKGCVLCLCHIFLILFVCVISCLFQYYTTLLLHIWLIWPLICIYYIKNFNPT